MTLNLTIVVKLTFNFKKKSIIVKYCEGGVEDGQAAHSRTTSVIFHLYWTVVLKTGTSRKERLLINWYIYVPYKRFK